MQFNFWQIMDIEKAKALDGLSKQEGSTKITINVVQDNKGAYFVSENTPEDNPDDFDGMELLPVLKDINDFNV